MGSRRRPQPLRLPIKLLRIRQSLDLSQEQMAKRLETKRSHTWKYRTRNEPEGSPTIVPPVPA